MSKTLLPIPDLAPPWPKRRDGCPLLMGIVNVTPDSFSDGGHFACHDQATAHARLLEAEGADILDIGGESTRPGYDAVPAEEEMRRVLPVISALIAEAPRRCISIDTYKSETARAALAAGARVVNDVWGLERDPAIVEVVAEAGAGLVIMHNRAERDASLDIVADMAHAFEKALARAHVAGIPLDRIAIDPGIGFGKTRPQEVAAIRAIPLLRREFGCAVLLGVSRKSMLGIITGRPVTERLHATIAANCFGMLAEADILRVHDIAAHRDAALVMATLMGNREIGA